jgi:hypothetical protein
MEKAKTKTRSFFQRFSKGPNAHEPEDVPSIMLSPECGNKSSEAPGEAPPATPAAQLDARVTTQLLPTEYTPYTMGRDSVAGSASPSISVIQPTRATSLETEQNAFFKTPNTSSSGTLVKWLIVGTDLKETRVSKSLSELSDAVAKFKENYEQFAVKNRKVFLIDSNFQKALQDVEAGGTVRLTAQAFGDQIRDVLRTIETKKELSKTGWISRLGTFVTKLYPVASLSLNLVTGVAQVISQNS